MSCHGRDGVLASRFEMDSLDTLLKAHSRESQSKLYSGQENITSGQDTKHWDEPALVRTMS